MKKRKPLATNSLEMRNLVRYMCAPPTSWFKDHKKYNDKNKCRQEDEN